MELGNAMLYSGLKDVTVNMPLDSQAYAEMLAKLVENSRWQKKTVENTTQSDEFNKSF